MNQPNNRFFFWNFKIKHNEDPVAQHTTPMKDQYLKELPNKQQSLGSPLGSSE